MYVQCDFPTFRLYFVFNEKTIHSKSTVGAGVGVGGSNDGRLVVG